ncbi:MAG: ClpP family protease [Christensenellales bacterium]|jgi:ATP-dependent protease ClpP protease subunit
MTQEKQEQKQMPANTLDMIKEMGLPPQMDKSGFQCITIIGQIEGHTILPPQSKATKYEHIIPMLIAMEQSEEIKGILFVMNTEGGDVEAGLAIAELIATMHKPTVSLVLGGGHSIGVPLAVAAQYSFICATAAMTLHPIRMNGLIVNDPQTFEYFGKMQERILSFITMHSKVKRETLDGLISRHEGPFNDVGTVLVGEEAVQCGLIGAVGGLHDALEKLKELSEQHQRMQ